MVALACSDFGVIVTLYLGLDDVGVDVGMEDALVEEFLGDSSEVIVIFVACEFDCEEVLGL